LDEIYEGKGTGEEDD
jgi:superfamily II DNA helicase RecQ